jgi:hypothetical protein
MVPEHGAFTHVRASVNTFRDMAIWIDPVG